MARLRYERSYRQGSACTRRFGCCRQTIFTELGQIPGKLTLWKRTLRMILAFRLFSELSILRMEPPQFLTRFLLAIFLILSMYFVWNGSRLKLDGTLTGTFMKHKAVGL